jgi:hypothetical protein
MFHKLHRSKWTQTAIECYQRGCRCNGCFYENYFTKGKCQMKYTVLELVRQLGAPNKMAQNEP